MRLLVNYLSVLGVLVFSKWVMADRLIEPFADKNQRIMYSSSLGVATYPLTLGTFKKINGEWSSSDDVLVEGRLEKSTYELESPVKLESAYSHLRQYFEELGGRLLFACDGLSCGRSNVWANERFGIKQLYGLDSSQHYRVWHVQRGEIVAFVSAYLVQRGNRRVYLQLESLYPTDKQLQFSPTAAVIAKEFYSRGHIEILGLSFEQGHISVNEKYIKNYAWAFNQQSFRNLTITGVDSFPGSEEDRLERSQKYAQAVFDALRESGVHPRRLRVSTRSEAPKNVSNADGAVFVSLN